MLYYHLRFFRFINSKKILTILHLEVRRPILPKKYRKEEKPREISKKKEEEKLR